MIFGRFTERSLLPEIMDDFDLEGEMLSDALSDIAWVNRWLGGNQISVQGVQDWIERYGSRFTRPIRIADIGCGGGDTLRAIADMAQRKGWNITLTGIDANAYTIDYARQASADYPDIQYVQADVLDSSCRLQDYDVLLCGLFLHHLRSQELDQLVAKAKTAGVGGMIVNDLQRHPLAYYGFKVISFFLRPSEMARQDGLVSILRGFRKKELVALFTAHQLSSYTIQWKWAFRYVVILSFSPE